MEEADVLCNRIGIVCRGRLKCVGSSLRLKNKYGEGYTLGVNFKEGKRDLAYQYVKKILPEVVLHTEFKGNMLFEIEKKFVKVSKVFKEIEAQKSEFGIIDWALSQTTLEDVFLNIVRKDEEAAAKELEEERRYYEDHQTIEEEDAIGKPEKVNANEDEESDKEKEDIKPF